MVRVGLKFGSAKGHGNASPNVVAERDGSQKISAVNPELLANRQCRRHDGTTRMRLGRSMGVVGLVGVSQHTVRQRSFHRAGQDVRSHNGCNLQSGVITRKSNRSDPGRQVAAGNHRRKGVEEMKFDALCHFLR